MLGDVPFPFGAQKKKTIFRGYGYGYVSFREGRQTMVDQSHGSYGMDRLMDDFQTSSPSDLQLPGEKKLPPPVHLCLHVS